MVASEVFANQAFTTVQSGGTGQTVQDVYEDRVVYTGRRYTKAPRRYTKSRCRC